MSGKLLTTPRVTVTGAGGPMGLTIARRLAQAGACGLALTDISGTRLGESAALLGAEFPGLEIVSLRGDMTRADEAGAFASAALAGLGGIDVLVNTVGGLRAKQLYTPMLEMTEEQWRATFDLNLMGCFHLTRAFAPGMLERGAGRIVNFATIVFGGEYGQADYAAAKAGVASLTRSLAAELAPHVTVNAVAPGLTRTSVTQNMPEAEAVRLVAGAFNRRMAEPGEIAEAVAFFTSESARFVTGEIIAVSGGIHPHL
ncbi:SDR family NAD(P)-dependent oxidoreductase [Acidocella aromatica]|uniref:3-oxoacyl-[acyl-carrier protein] reductase n=1 Tax=Acidocella aromatica TaxID=1303579 RepID=A0A840VLN8_9PROT|nr:SDR family NAD(P)-dependent oxidoreductase [Acidocella aromatica]MBB5374055.1 3-oxoacyl-[acyl-carrier protein] reductase [Acidocella aromatica]